MATNKDAAYILAGCSDLPFTRSTEAVSPHGVRIPIAPATPGRARGVFENDQHREKSHVSVYSTKWRALHHLALSKLWTVDGHLSRRQPRGANTRW